MPNLAITLHTLAPDWSTRARSTLTATPERGSEDPVLLLAAAVAFTVIAVLATVAMQAYLPHPR